MGFSSGGGRSGMSEINVTPLVDVMLVLLIIFMVTAPLIQQGVKVDLPEAKAQAIEEKDSDLLVLAIKADRSMYIGDAPVSLEELEEKLKHNPKAQKQKELHLHADRSLDYGFVVDVMARVQNAGIPAIGMITDPVERQMKDAKPAKGKR
ncbi:protein TolR [Vulgatibacter sp.]|uniref:protein TolR n=1 Tax=Vulgatibacter sp. TaxID=1971226 RepID=UPI00356175A6